MNVQIIEIHQPHRVMWMMHKYGNRSSFATITLVKGKTSKRYSLPITLHNVPERLTSHLKRICEFKLINNKEEDMEKHQFKPFDQVLVRDGLQGIWYTSFYSHYDHDNDRHQCVSSFWEQCIPYNEETAHLIGTDQPYQPAKPKEYYVSWGPDSEMQQTEYTAEEFMHFIKTAVINNKDVSNFIVRRIRS